jgi:hypothetical protein
VKWSTPYILSRICGDYIRRHWIYNWIYWITHNYSYTLITESLTITTDSHTWVTAPAESLQGPGPPADPTGSHWPSTAANVRLCSPGAYHKENTVSDSSTVAWRHYWNRPQRKHLLLLSHVGCPATVVNKHLHCWLLTRSVHVTLCLYIFCRLRSAENLLRAHNSGYGEWHPRGTRATQCLGV